MNKRYALILLALALQPLAAGAVELSETEVINQARALALTQISRAHAASNNNGYRQMGERLLLASFVVGAGSGCTGNTEAYMDLPEPFVYLCPHFFGQARRHGLDYVSAIVVHEAAHMIGIVSECRAELTAQRIRQINGLRAVTSGYDARCGWR